VSDIGVIDQVGTDEKKDHTDSFEKYYNKDLDLDEGTFRFMSIHLLANFNHLKKHAIFHN